MADSMVFENVYDEYEYYLDKYQQEYGENTIILYQCGGFYEIYSINDGKVPVKDLCDMLDVEVSRRNKSIAEVNRINCMMMGWPIGALEKFVEILVDNHFTVVIVDQMDNSSHTPTALSQQKTVLKGKNRIHRAVTHIFSQGTYLDHLSPTQQQTGKYVMVIYVETIKLRFKVEENAAPISPMERGLTYGFGISVVDASTGESMFFEVLPRQGDPSYVFDELLRLRLLYPPCELVFVSLPYINEKGCTLNPITTQELCTAMNVNSGSSQSHVCQVINKLHQLKADQTKRHYHNYVLGKVFMNCGLLTPIEYVDLERHQTARIAYVYALEHMQRHNENLLKKIDKPFSSVNTNLSLNNAHNGNDGCGQGSQGGQTLILSANTSEQLDIHNSLLKTLNTCQTFMGKRYFRSRLLNPSYDIAFLKSSYHKIATLLQFMEEKGESFENVGKELKKIYDVERLFRKVVMGTASASDMLHIHQSLESLNRIRLLIQDEMLVPLSLWEKNAQPLFTYLGEHLYNVNTQTDNMSSYTEEERQVMQSLNIYPLVQKHIYPSETLSRVLSGIVSKKKALDVLVDALNDVSEGIKPFKLEKTDRDGYFITSTNKRYNDLKTKLKAFVHEGFAFKDASVKAQANTVKITHPFFEKTSKALHEGRDEWQKETQHMLVNMMHEITEKFAESFRPLCTCLSELDYYITCAGHAFTKRYCAPIIQDTMQDSMQDTMKEPTSFLKCNDLRHPIVEIIDESIPFVGNDVVLGSGENRGMLLYGLNAAGKSTLMKSVALAVIMAQAGMYVAAESMVFYPYRSLFSRITRGDDIQRGQSTFMIEMQELRNIIKRSDSFSLVIGDELCSGTESASGIGIVAAGLYRLSMINKASFVFTTHLHDLTKIKCVEELRQSEKLRVCHLHVEYDPVTHKLVYDRKLKDGQGLSIYGLEVCKALDLGTDFIDMANSIRNEVLQKKEDKHKSRYNSLLYVDKCTICGKKAKEVHHIVFQKNADKNGFIGNMHKDKLCNLMNVCESCHDSIHRGEINVKGYQKTSMGVELIIEN